MAAVDKVIRAIRMDYAWNAVIQSILVGAIIFLILYILGTIPKYIGIEFQLFGYSYDVVISLTLAVLVALTTFIIKLTRFSFKTVEKKIPLLEDVLITAKQYRRKQNRFREELFKELSQAASQSSTGPLLETNKIALKVTIMVVLLATIYIAAFSHSVTYNDINKVVPDFIKDTGARFGINAQAPDVEIFNDGSIYGEQVDLQALGDQVTTLSLLTGSGGGNFEEEQELTFDRMFDAVYAAENIEAVVDPTEVQKLPNDVELARQYSLKLREIN